MHLPDLKRRHLIGSFASKNLAMVTHADARNGGLRRFSQYQCQIIIEVRGDTFETVVVVPLSLERERAKAMQRSLSAAKDRFHSSYFSLLVSHQNTHVLFFLSTNTDRRKYIFDSTVVACLSPCSSTASTRTTIATIPYTATTRRW